MSLTVETGSGSNPLADTYATVSDLRAFARKRGASVPQAEEDCEVLLVKGMDYLASIESRFKGCRVRHDQPLAWPRSGVYVEGFDLPYDTIPDYLKNAQMALAIEAQSRDLMPTRTPEKPGAIVIDTIGPMTQKFASPLTKAVFAKAEVFLAPICKHGMGMLWNVRA